MVSFTSAGGAFGLPSAVMTSCGGSVCAALNGPSMVAALTHSWEESRVYHAPDGDLSRMFGVFTTRFQPPVPQGPKRGAPLTEISTVARSVTLITGTAFERSFTSREESMAMPSTMVLSVASKPTPSSSLANSACVAAPVPSSSMHLLMVNSFSSTTPGVSEEVTTAVMSSVPAVGLPVARFTCTTARSVTVLPAIAV